MAKIRFLGHAAFYIQTQGFKILIDPFLTGNPQAAITADSITELDWIFLTHGHGDHLGDTVELAKRTGATVVSSNEMFLYLTSKGVNALGMHIGGRTRFPWGRVKLTPAWHGSGISEDEEVIYGGTPCGFLFETDGKVIYYAGDTGITMEMMLLAEEGVDLALLPIGGHYTMDAEDAARAVRLIKPRMVVPMHYDTFPPIKADPREFAKLVGDAAEVKILAPGDFLEV